MSAFTDFIKPSNADFKNLLHAWWEELQQARGNRAVLRRAKTAEEILISPAYQRTIIAQIRARGLAPTINEQERLALGIGVLSHAKEPTNGPHMARRLGQLQILDETIRDLRFRRLLTITDRDELYIGLLRMLNYMEKKVEPVSLVHGAYWWDESTKKDWAKKYYVWDKKNISEEIPS